MKSENNSLPRLINSGEGLNVFYKDRFLYSKKRPDASVEKLVDSLSLNEFTLYLIPSPLLFKGISRILKKLPRNSFLLCLEKDQTLARFSIDYAIRDNKLEYIRSADTRGLLKALEDKNDLFYRDADIIALNGAYALNKAFYLETLNEIRKLLSLNWKNKMTMIYMSRMWIQNIFRNIVYCSNNNAISDIKIKKPILTVGAGESLEKNINEIKKNRDRLYILAADTALPALIHSGILPDAVVALEAQIYNLRDFYDLSDNEKMTLFYDLSSHPRVHDFFNGPKIPFISRFSKLNIFSDLERYALLPFAIPPLGSVGLTALFLASKLSEDSVGFIGLDFSYNIGKSHSKGVESHKRLLYSSNRIKSSDYSLRHFAGGSRKYSDFDSKVWSDPVLYNYSIQCREVLKNGYYIDCGTGGFISGTNKASVSDLAKLANKDNVTLLSAPKKTEKIKIKEFFEEKKEALTAIMDISAAGWSAELEGLLKKEDYIYCDFPEIDIFSHKDAAILSRLKKSAAKYLKVIEKALIVAF